MVIFVARQRRNPNNAQSAFQVYNSHIRLCSNLTRFAIKTAAGFIRVEPIGSFGPAKYVDVQIGPAAKNPRWCCCPINVTGSPNRPLLYVEI